MKSPFLRFLSLGSFFLALTGCQTPGLEQLSGTQVGIVYRKLPPLLGGGVQEKVIPQAQKIFVWPWDEIYRLDTAEKFVSWQIAHGEEGEVLYTRAADGNEVALAITVSYQIIPNGERLANLLSNVARSDEEVRELVKAVARADIRTAMNHLKTAQFASVRDRYEAVSNIRTMMNERLAPLGIEVQRVNLDDFQFERLLPDGSVDSSYQEKLAQIQKLTEDTERQKMRLETIRAKKAKEAQDVQAKVNQQIEEAQGYKQQAVLRGDGYFATKSNEAEGIRAQGIAEATGLKEQIAALQGAGGTQLVKLRLVQKLLENGAKFVLIPPGGGNGMELRKTDINAILTALGAFEQDATKKEQQTSASQGDKK